MGEIGRVSMFTLDLHRLATPALLRLIVDAEHLGSQHVAKAKTFGNPYTITESIG